jgi:predicted transcriptional regulator
MSTTTTRPTTLKIEQSIKDRVKRLADSRHRTPHRIMVDAISEYIEREEKRETFRQDGVRAWNEYQATGLHVSFAEADAWLAQLEAGQDSEPPACHV